MKDSLTSLECIGVPVANFASFKLPPHTDADRLIDHLREKDIYIKRCHGYPNAVRIAAQSPRDTETLVQEICAYMDSSR